MSVVLAIATCALVHLSSVAHAKEPPKKKVVYLTQIETQLVMLIMRNEAYNKRLEKRIEVLEKRLADMSI